MIPELQRIVCAAIILKSGHIIASARHFDMLMRKQIDRCGLTIRGAEQGFIDQWGNFLSREEAWIVAERQEQIRKHTGPHGTLFSEDLY